jgi:hypothetical protein
MSHLFLTKGSGCGTARSSQGRVGFARPSGPRCCRRTTPVFGSEGISVIAAAEIVNGHGRSGHGVTPFVRTSQGERTIAGSDILVAAGRTPNTAGIGLEIAGDDLDQRGYVKVHTIAWRRPREMSGPSANALAQAG